VSLLLIDEPGITAILTIIQQTSLLTVFIFIKLAFSPYALAPIQLSTLPLHLGSHVSKEVQYKSAEVFAAFFTFKGFGKTSVYSSTLYF
jgi:hypothetical protein